MASRKNISVLLLLFTVMIVSYSCRKEYDTINYQYVPTETKKFIFMPGSTWIYKSDTGLLYDTVVCTATVKDSIDYIITTKQDSKVRFIDEYYKMTLKHSYGQTFENHFFYNYVDKVNCNIIDNKLIGQCVMLAGSKEKGASTDGFRYENDTILSVDIITYPCDHNHIISNEQVVPLYFFDTDLFIAPNIGLIRKFDSSIGWKLQHFYLNPINF